MKTILIILVVALIFGVVVYFNYSNNQKVLKLIDTFLKNPKDYIVNKLKINVNNVMEATKEEELKEILEKYKAITKNEFDELLKKSANIDVYYLIAEIKGRTRLVLIYLINKAYYYQTSISAYKNIFSLLFGF